MGNCLVLQASAVVRTILKTDGKVIEYKATIQAEQVLSEYAVRVISDSLPVLQQLQPKTRLQGGQSYYLVPQALKTSQKKKVRFSNPDVESEKKSGAVRIKLVISKHQLHEMLQKGWISVGDLVVSQLESSKTDAADMPKSNGGCQVWEPVLESIPEAD